MRSLVLKIGFLFLIPSLLTGSIFYEPRLGIVPELLLSFNTLSFLVAFFCMLVELNKFPKKLILLAVSMCLLALHSFISAYVFGVDQTGAMKFANFIFIGFTLAMLMHALSLRGQLQWAIRVIVFTLFGLFLAAIVVKMQTGFWSRHNLYFLHGPIVFGRLMAMGLILNLAFPVMRGMAPHALNGCFAFGIIWSLSKGPILASLVCVIVYFLINRTAIFRLKYLIGFVAVAVFGYYFISTIGVVPDQLKRLIVLIDIFQGNTLAENSYGSVGVRQDMFRSTFGMILSSPVFGVGLGNWGAYYANGSTQFTYPHNLFLEVFAELGIFTGSVLSALLLAPLRYRRDPFFFLFLFLFLAQQTSGDMADGRFLFFATCLVLFRHALRDRIDIQGGF